MRVEVVSIMAVVHVVPVIPKLCIQPLVPSAIVETLEVGEAGAVDMINQVGPCRRHGLLLQSNIYEYSLFQLTSFSRL